MTLKKTLKVVLSFWLVYHLVVIVFFPNNSSYLVRHYSLPFQAYANQLALNTSWNFFSPDPAHVMYFKYLIYSKDENLEPAEYFIPPEKNEGSFGPADRRLFYAMRYMLLDQRRVEGILGPWLCKQHPEATKIHIEHIVEKIPSLDEVAFLDKSTDSDQEIKTVNMTLDCLAPNEVSL